MAVELKRSRVLDSLNMTPLIDVVFILLIFFLVAARFANEDYELPVQLPFAKSALPMTVEPQILQVAINEKGEYFLDSQKVDLASLEASIGRAVANNPLSQTVIIRGDRRVPFQQVVSVMDLCNRLKVPSYKVTTATEQQ